MQLVQTAKNDFCIDPVFSKYDGRCFYDRNVEGYFLRRLDRSVEQLADQPGCDHRPDYLADECQISAANCSYHWIVVFHGNWIFVHDCRYFERR